MKQIFGLGLDTDALEKSIRAQVVQSLTEGPDAPAPDGRDRKSFLGGSEIAAVMGLSPWATPLDIYFRKTGTRPPAGMWRDPQREKNFKRGKRAEPHAIDMAIEDLGIKVTKRSTEEEKNYYVDPVFDFLAVEIDAEFEVTQALADQYDLPPELVGTIQNIEVKSVHPFAAGKFGEEATDEVPIEYGAQAMYGLGVTGRKLCMFLVLKGWDDLTLYFVHANLDTISGMRAIAVKFWNDHIVARVAPEAQNLPDVMNLFRRVGAFKVTADEKTVELIAQLDAERRAARVAKEKVDDTQFLIGCAILGKEQMEHPDDPGSTTVVDAAGKPILRIDFQQQYDLNEAKLKAMFPGVAEACAKIQQFFKMTVPKPKKDPAAKSVKAGKE